MVKRGRKLFRAKCICKAKIGWGEAGGRELGITVRNRDTQ